MDLMLSNTVGNQGVKVASADFEVIRNALMTLDEIRIFDDSFATWQAATSVSQHRKSHRVSVKCPLKISSLDGGQDDISVKLDATSQDISPFGISFVCRETLPFRRVLIEFPGTSIPGLVSELTWCRFTREQLHQCGGSFTGIHIADA